MAQPELLLLDEPFLGLSLGMQGILVDAIVAIRDARGITVMVSEQYARPLFPIVDYGYIMESGMVVLEGTGDALIQNKDVRSAYFGV